MSLSDAAERVGVTPATLRRWIRQGLIPRYDGEWTRAAIGQARVVARMRERGHSLEQIRTATEEGRLACGFLEELFPSQPQRYSFKDAARETGVEEELIKRVIAGPGVNTESVGTVSGDEQMHAMSRQVLPLAGPVLDQIHQRYLRFFIDQDIVGHMESDLDGTAVDLGRMRVAIAFADLTGYTRMTEEEGELSAVDAVERFVEAVEVTLPDEARIIKTIGDEVMIIGSDASAHTDWAVGFQAMQTDRPRPRIAVHCGVALFRDGDYYGRDINIASRVAARSAGGEVLATRPVVEVAREGGSHLEFERIGEVTLKGFSESTEVFMASQRREESG